MRTTPLATLTALALSGLVLVGCSSHKDAATEDTASAAASASSSGEQAETSAAPSASPLPTLANGEEVKLTDEERAAYEAGKYVAATEQHPALNVPEPVMPELAKEQSFEGAKAFLEYWNEARNYAIQTGDISIVKNLVDTDWTSQRDYYDAIDTEYVAGSWVVGSESFITIPENGFNFSHENGYDIIVIRSENSGSVYDKNGNKIEDLVATNSTEQPTISILRYESGKWIYEQSSGIQGVKYEN